jgi:hypothetical protein
MNFTSNSGLVSYRGFKEDSEPIIPVLLLVTDTGVILATEDFDAIEIV